MEEDIIIVEENGSVHYEKESLEETISKLTPKLESSEVNDSLHFEDHKVDMGIYYREFDKMFEKDRKKAIRDQWHKDATVFNHPLNMW